MPVAPRYLTKSRFKLALECPTKLHYTGKRDYANRSLDDSFLAALAEGGYQVGALACAMFPGGVEVDARSHEEQLARTRELLALDEVTIYEAAFAAEGLFVRVDILRKVGHRIDLIEVKAKSYHPLKDGDFRNKKGNLTGSTLPYLQDIAFQRHVVGLAFPQFDYRCFLMMADTSRAASVDGLNQRFRIDRTGSRIRVTMASGSENLPLGDPILTAVPVDDQVAQIFNGPLAIGREEPTDFATGVRLLGEAYRADERIAPKPSAGCQSCEFRAKAPVGADSLRSGFHECWSDAFGLEPDELARGTVLDLWNFRRKDDLIAKGVVRLEQLTEGDIDFDGSAPDASGMTVRHRQWYQLRGGWPGGGDFFIAAEELRAARSAWRYPLHFIDFETSAAPIPFSRGRFPYQTTAFQFSHHVLHADGRVEHRSQFLDATPARNPNLNFLRALHNALRSDDGTVFRWAAHENTVLGQLRHELLEASPVPKDAAELIAFIDSLTIRAHEAPPHAGARAMVDMCKLAEQFFFHPASNGSSSLKKVLPALMRSSEFLRDTYGRPVYGTPAMPSLNLTEPVAWWQEKSGEVCDPYKLLPPVFVEFSREEQDDLDAGLAAELKDGGAAMAAYAQLQSQALPDAHRHRLEAALLRYCELDTLAMVMTLQAWDAWLAQR